MPGVSQLQPHLYASVRKGSPGRQADGNTERTATEPEAQKHRVSIGCSVSSDIFKTDVMSVLFSNHFLIWIFLTIGGMF